MIVFLHGAGSPGREYWKAWAESLLPGLLSRGLPLSKSDFYGIYYRDLVTRLSEEDQAAVSLVLNRIRTETLDELQKHGGFFAAKTAFIKNYVEAIVHTFAEIYSYLYHQNAHRATNERVRQCLAEFRRPVTLIGFSLGSLVGYCALQEDRQTAESVGHLIMVGSPLFWFKEGIAQHADLGIRPGVGRFTNIAGILDLARPQKVPEVLTGLDQNTEFVINPVDPVRGHLTYFHQPISLNVIAAEIAKGMRRSP